MNQVLTSDETAHFLTLPDQVLINVVLPRFSYNVLEGLCSSNVRFNDVCQNDQLWNIKVTNELTSFISRKSIDVKWRDYYFSFLRPVYYHGDIIGSVIYSPDVIGQTIDAIISYIDLGRSMNIVFIDGNRDPYIIVNYPSYSLDVRNTNYLEVDRILLTKCNEFSKIALFWELASPFGMPAVYGVQSHDRFYILVNDHNNLGAKCRSCDTYSINDLHNILISLKVDPDIFRLYRPNNLCVLIQKKLREIGHII